MKIPEHNPVDTKKLWKVTHRLEAVLKKEFGTNNEGDPRVQLELTDRSRYWRPCFQPVFYSHLCETPEDYLEVLQRSVGNLQTAAERVRIELDCLRMLNDCDKQRAKVSRALRIVFDQPVTLEQNFGFFEAKPPWHFWGKAVKNDESDAERFKFKGNSFQLKDDFKPLIRYVHRIKGVLVKTYGKAIQGWAVSLTSFGAQVFCLVKMTEKHIAEIKIKIAARRLAEAEEKKVKAKIGK
jgi:hypothetical protein